MYKGVDFDHSLEEFVKILHQSMAPEAITAGRVVRNHYGKLLFICAPDHSVDQKTKGKLKSALREALGDYIASHQPVMTAEAPGWERLYSETRGLAARVVKVNDEDIPVQLLERRQHEDDWLEAMRDLADGPPRLVFYSLKGGVGRTTALVMLAVELARLGKNVLTIDCDLEAPGLASLLLSDAELPTYGLLDALVENSLGGVDDDFLKAMVTTARLSSAKGKVVVAPAMGRLCADHPENIMPKLSRALMEDLQPDGPPHSVGRQLRDIVDRLVAADAYDVVLIDCRAGLAEIAAGPVLYLGGQVLFFGTAQQQTYTGYEALFASLAPYLQASDIQRFRFIHAKASKYDEISWINHELTIHVKIEPFLKKIKSDNAGELLFSLSIATFLGERIYFEQDYMDFDPMENKSLFESRAYRFGFGDFLMSCCEDLLGIKHDGAFNKVSRPRPDVMRDSELG